MATSQRLAPGLAVLAAMLAAASCDSGNHDSEPPLVVSAIETDPFVAYRSVPFTITGSGFLRSDETPPPAPASILTGLTKPPLLPGTLTPQVTVTFRTTDGTPFADGTSAEAQVAGSVISDTEIQGTTPITNSTGIWSSTVEVTDSIGTGVSATEIALFAGLTVFDIDAEEISAPQATPIEVFGLTFLPVGGNATIRFTSVVPGAFPGASDTLDVPGTVGDPTHISGVTPVLSLTSPITAYVTIILDDEPGTPQATSACALTVFEPPPPVPVAVTGITPSPLPLTVPTAFTVTGSGFLGAGDPDVAVIFTATSGTPHFRGTAVSVSVPGTAINDNTVTGTSPTGTSATDVNAFVTVARADGVSATSATAIALFAAPVEAVDTFTPSVFCPNAAAAFTITGSNLPTPQNATVRFRAVNGAPFVNGTAETVDVVAAITSATQIDGQSPLATSSLPFLAEVTVILQSGVELPMGIECLFGLFPQCQAAPGANVVTNLLDSGPGSLRDVIFAAPPGSIITFQPGLTGTLGVQSTLLVSQSVEILGPGAGVIRVSAQSGDYPVFTIETGAAAAIIERLTIAESSRSSDGGGLFVRGGLTLTQCDVADNGGAGRGAGIFVAAGGTLTMTECTLRNNSGSGAGGALSLGTGVTVQANGCTFEQNESGGGGAAVATTTLATFSAVNCTFQGNNTVGGPGGGAILVASNSIVNLTHCTLSENSTANRGGGVLNQGRLNATNCIFSRNSDGKGDVEISNKGNATNNTTFSLVRVGEGSDLDDGEDGNIVGTDDDPIDAQLGELLPNGGPTRTMALRADSPALNAASVSTVLKDQRGVVRPQGAGPDMGAYEETVNL